jgi:hypothetical protein
VLGPHPMRDASPPEGLRYAPLAGVKKPVTVPETVMVPPGIVNVFRAAGMSQLTVPSAWLCFIDMSVWVIVVPPVGVNENVVSNASERRGAAAAGQLERSQMHRRIAHVRRQVSDGVDLETGEPHRALMLDTTGQDL